MNRESMTAAIILAAGSSSRMGSGRHKLLLPLGNRPVLSHVIEATLASHVEHIIIVLGHQAEQVRTSIAPYAEMPAITIIENPDYGQGMSSSLRTGLQVLTNQNSVRSAHIPDSTLILLGDQPLMSTEIIEALITAREQTRKRIIVPLYSGKRGNPVLFAADLFPELMQITGDEGGRSVIERHRQEVAVIELSDSTPSFDVDTWEAYQQVVREWQQKQ